ncbi:MAG: hypothetical protein ACPLRM_04800, partial [Anaerolineae bacterium]
VPDCPGTDRAIPQEAAQMTASEYPAKVHYQPGIHSAHIPQSRPAYCFNLTHGMTSRLGLQP